MPNTSSTASGPPSPTGEGSGNPARSSRIYLILQNRHVKNEKIQGEIMHLGFFIVNNYPISCSSSEKTSDAKKSFIDISKPSHSFFNVETVTLLFLPLTILLRVDCVTPDMIASLLIVISLELHSSIILNLQASPIFINTHPFGYIVTHLN